LWKIPYHYLIVICHILAILLNISSLGIVGSSSIGSMVETSIPSYLAPKRSVEIFNIVVTNIIEKKSS
jgi:hypothetical protein